MENNKKKQIEKDKIKNKLRVLSPDIIIQKINAGKEVYYKDREIDGLDFNKIKNKEKRIIAGYAQMFNVIKKPISLIDCRLKNFNAQKTEFQKSVSFLKSQFFEETSFSSAEFLAFDTSFWLTRFMGNTDFNHVKFKGDNLYFNFAIFEGRETRFYFTQFLGKYVSFQNTTFSGSYTSFDYAHFKGKIFFNELTVDTKFEFTHINGHESIILFDKIDFETKKQLFTNISDIKEIKFVDCKCFTCSFVYSDLANFKFINITWPKDWKIYDEKLINWPKDRTDKKEKEAQEEKVTQEEKIQHIRKTEEEYNQLKNYYRKENKHREADYFHRGELEMKRLQNPKICRYLSWEGLYKCTSNYGLSWLRPFFIGIFTPLIFSFLIIIGYISDQHLFYEKKFNVSTKEFEVYPIKFDNYPQPKTVPVQVKNSFCQNICRVICTSIIYNYSNAFFIKNEKIFSNNSFVWFLSRLENIIVTALFILAGFAIRRKFRT